MSKFHIFNYFKTYLNYVMNLMTIGAGCFWCVEAIFNQIAGVTNVTSGYSGGSPKSKLRNNMYRKKWSR